MPIFNPKMSLSDIHNNLNLSFENKPSSFLKLLEKHIHFDSFIPESFKSDFYKSMGRKHIYELESFIRFFVLQNVLGIPSDIMLINILNLSNELRIFCRFHKIPDASQFSRFRTNYHANLADMFRNFDEDFKSAHPETAVKKTDNPDVDKEVADAKSLKPVLTDFIAMHPKLEFKTFLADSAFDSYEIFAMLRDSFRFSRVCIPINKRNTKLEPADFDEKGIPVCPLTKEPFIYQGIVHEKGRSDRIKWTCNKAKPFNKGKFVCDTLCTSSKYGRCVYTGVDKNFRLCPGIQRDTEHWKNLYRHSVQIEQTINLIKDTFSVNYRKSYHTVSAKSNVYLAVITQLIGVILADAIHQLKNFKSIRKLIAS